MGIKVKAAGCLVGVSVMVGILNLRSTLVRFPHAAKGPASKLRVT